MANTREHRYTVSITWNGNLGTGTSGYRDYSRDYEISPEGKSAIHGSADPAFRGDRSRWNPEELLVASLSACHKLWYLHLAAEAGVIVTAYADRAEGALEVGRDGVGQFKKRGAASNRDRGAGQRCSAGTNAPQTRAREVLHCQFSQFPCRVRAGDRRGRLSGGRVGLAIGSAAPAIRIRRHREEAAPGSGELLRRRSPFGLVRHPKPDPIL